MSSESCEVMTDRNKNVKIRKGCYCRLEVFTLDSNAYEYGRESSLNEIIRCWKSAETMNAAYSTIVEYTNI